MEEINIGKGGGKAFITERKEAEERTENSVAILLFEGIIIEGQDGKNIGKGVGKAFITQRKRSWRENKEIGHYIIVSRNKCWRTRGEVS